ncbi:MAG: hypothetical protein JO016_01740 [Actinobacteria bacterium]|nr:hypothetical protein [Actinomycetota bacterium]
MLIPHQYRTVAFTTIGGDLSPESLAGWFADHPVYRRTRFVIACSGAEVALAEVEKGPAPAGDDLFCPVTSVKLLAGPAETILVTRPEIDTAVPSQLARVAAEFPGHRCVAVKGRYEHVNFVLDADPPVVHVLDVAPPWPAKFCDQVDRLLEVAESLPPVLTRPQVVDLQELARAEPATHYLLPCRGGGARVPGATISYLDEVPPPDPGWVLLGCARSRAIHDHFYPENAASLRQIDMCPARLAAESPVPAGEARLTKCCLLEEHIETRGDTVVVPWGASFDLVTDGLRAAAALAETRRGAR